MASSFLRRAKSTRDNRKRLPRDHQQEEAGTSLALALLSPIKKSHGQQSQQANSNTNIWTRTRMRRKSFSSNRESMVALGLPDTWNPPSTTTTITAEERKKRTSAFFGLISPAAPPEPKRAPPPPPPIRLSVFPQPPRNRPATATGSYGGMNDESVIGVAIGSPTGTLAVAGGDRISNSQFPSLASLVTPRDSPGFFLPNSPFGIDPRTPVSVSVTKAYEEPEVVEGPKTGGWKRIFGKGLFGRKGTVKAPRGPMPDTVDHTVRMPSPRVLTKSSKNRIDTRRTPCLDVDIPNVEMERYSVMFGTLLHPLEKSTLYARRRSRDVSQFGSYSDDSLNNGRAPMGHSLEVPKLQMNTLKRNATTTSHISPRSPLSMLGDDLRRLSSESRSRSSSPSPGLSPGLWRRGTTAADGRPPASPHKPHNDLLTPPEFATPGLAHSTDRSSVPLPIQRPSSRSSAISRISEESSTPSTPSFDGGDDHHFQIISNEPTWEMLNTSSKNRIVHHEISLPSSPEDELEVAAQISIARQISISKRQLLIPVVPKAQMLVSRESLKPRLVEHRRSRSSKLVLKEGEKAEFGCAV